MRTRAMFSPGQCRAGRGLLGWSQDRLAASARLEPEAVELYERGEGQLSTAELTVLGAAFNSAGVIAVAENCAGEGVRFNRPSGSIVRAPLAQWTRTTPPDVRGA